MIANKYDMIQAIIRNVAALYAAGGLKESTGEELATEAYRHQCGGEMCRFIAILSREESAVRHGNVLLRCDADAAVIDAKVKEEADSVPPLPSIA